ERGPGGAAVARMRHVHARLAAVLRRGGVAIVVPRAVDAAVRCGIHLGVNWSNPGGSSFTRTGVLHEMPSSEKPTNTSRWSRPRSLSRWTVPVRRRYLPWLSFGPTWM